MFEYLRPNSVLSGIVLIAVYSGILALVLGRIRRGHIRVAALIAAPFMLAYLSYWIPAWLAGGGQEEYVSWAFLFIGPWLISGLIASLLVGCLVWKFFVRE
jgi:hypothetical protein